MSKPTPKKDGAERPPTYLANEKESAVLKKQIERLTAQPPTPRLKVVKDSPGHYTLDHPDYVIARGLVAEALGTADTDFVDAIFAQIAVASADERGIDPVNLNFTLSVMKGIRPTDQLEAMLAAQMAVVHMGTMKYARRLLHGETLVELEIGERFVSKMSRTFTMQMEALKRYRTGGEQKVTVQHVSVGEGGQAIVGNVTQAAPDKKVQDRKAVPLALTDARQEPMPILGETKREAVAAVPKAKNGK